MPEYYYSVGPHIRVTIEPDVLLYARRSLAANLNSRHEHRQCDEYTPGELALDVYVALMSSVRVQNDFVDLSDEFMNKYFTNWRIDYEPIDNLSVAHRFKCDSANINLFKQDYGFKELEKRDLI